VEGPIIGVIYVLGDAWFGRSLFSAVIRAVARQDSKCGIDFA
jgi:hypothetical protein